MKQMDSDCKPYNPCRTSCSTPCNCSNCKSNCCNTCILKNSCDFEGVQPAILSMPYPERQVCCENKYYAKLLSQDYCGAGSELTAITQYINHEIRLSGCHCEVARTLLAIAQAEMIHLQMLGELIVLLGQPLAYDAYEKCSCTTWTPYNITLGTNYNSIICADIDGEYAAIKQYEKHVRKIDDCHIKAILNRIVMDEKYHISLLRKLLK